MSNVSNDLISRSAVFKLIESKCTDGCLGNKDITLIDAYDLLDDVSDLPTAYDVDKIVEQLEKERNIQYRKDGSKLSDRNNISIDKTIKIVKAGGTNET